MSTSNVHISIDYDEDGSGAYRAVELAGPHGFVHRFATGDVVADFLAAQEVGSNMAQEQRCRFFMSSSCDHFVMDNEGYMWTVDELIVRRDA